MWMYVHRGYSPRDFPWDTGKGKEWESISKAELTKVMFAYSKPKQAASKTQNVSCKQRYLGSTMCFLQRLHFSKALCKRLAAGELIKMHRNINISLPEPTQQVRGSCTLRSVGTLPGHSALYEAEKPLISTTALNIPLTRAKPKRVKLLVLPRASQSKSYRSLLWVFIGTDIRQCAHTHLKYSQILN